MCPEGGVQGEVDRICNLEDAPVAVGDCAVVRESCINDPVVNREENGIPDAEAKHICKPAKEDVLVSVKIGRDQYRPEQPRRHKETMHQKRSKARIPLSDWVVRKPEKLIKSSKKISEVHHSVQGQDVEVLVLMEPKPRLA